MTDKVNPSYNRPAKSDEVGQLIARAANSGEGYVVPVDSVFLADRDADLATDGLNAFAESHSASSYDVTIDPGEAIVNGAWVARDVETTVTLDASTTGQMVYVGWDTADTAGAGNTVIIGTSSNFAADDYKLPLWEFDTDDSGVTSAIDHRQIGPKSQGGVHKSTLESGESLTIEEDESLVVGGEYDVQGDLDVQGRMDVVSGSPDHASVQNADPDAHLSRIATEVITLTGGTQPAYDEWLTNLVDDQYQKFEVVDSVEAGLNETYAYNLDISKRWNGGSWDIGITVNWDEVPEGATVKLRIDVHKR